MCPENARESFKYASAIDSWRLHSLRLTLPTRFPCVTATHPSREVSRGTCHRGELRFSATSRKASRLIDRVRVHVPIIANKHGDYFRITAASKNELIQVPSAGFDPWHDEEVRSATPGVRFNLLPPTHVPSPQVTLGRRVCVASRPRAISPNLDSSCSSGEWQKAC